MPNADVVWIDVLPSMRQFGDQLNRGVGTASAQAGERAGQDFGGSFQRTAVSSVEAASEKMAAALRKTEDAAGKVRVAEAALEGVRAKTNATQAQIVAAEERLASARRAADAANANLETSTKRVAEAQERAAASTREQADAMGEASTKAGLYERSMEKVKGAMGSLAGIAAGAGAGLAATFWSNVGRDKDQDRLTAQLGLDPMQALAAGKAAGALFRGAYGESLEDVNAAVGAVMSSISGMRNASQADLQAVSGAALDIADAFEIDVQTSAQTAGIMVQNGFAKTGMEAMDLLTVAFQRVPAAMREELPDIINEYGTYFSQMGFSGDQAFSLLVNAASNGQIALDKTGDAVKEFQIRSTDMSKTSVAAYDTLGLSAEQMANDILAGGERARGATTTIAKGLLEIEDPAERANTAIALFGTPLEDIGVNKVPVFLQSLIDSGAGMEGVEGAATGLGTTLADNFGTKMEAAKRTAIGFVQDGLMSLTGGFSAGAASSDGWKGALERGGVAVRGVWDIVKGFFAVFSGGDASGLERFGTSTMGAVVSVGEAARAVYDEVTGSFKAFAAAWKYNDGDITSSGMPGMFERLGYYAHQAWDVLTGSVIPALSSVATFLADNTWIIGGLVAAWAGYRAAMVISTAVTFAQTASQYGLSYALAEGGKAAKVYTAVQWLMNASVMGFPLVWIVAALAAVVAAIVLLWKNSETFRDIVTAVWGAVQSAISFAWERVIKPAFSALLDYWRLVAEGIAWAWENVVQPAWRAVGSAAEWLWNDVLRPAFAAIGSAWGALLDGVKWAWSNVLQPTWNVLSGVALELLRVLTVLVFLPIAAGWLALTEGAKWAWENVLRPAWSAVQAGAQFLWERVLSPVFGFIQDRWNTLVNNAKWAWENVLRPAWAAVEAGARWLWERALSPIFTWIGDRWDTVLRAMKTVYETVIRPVWTLFENAIGSVKTAFGTAVDGMKVAWDRIQGIAAKPINFVVRTVLRDGLFKAWNWVLEKLGITTWKVDTNSSWLQGIAGYATGGKVDGFSPTKTADNVPAWLTAGEWVHPVDSVRYYGRETMARIQNREIDPAALQYLATGGPVGFDSLVPGYANAGELFRTIKAAFPRANLNSSYRAGDPGYHGRNMAVDLGESGFAGGNGRAYLADMNRWIYDNFGKSTELIYNGAGDDRPNLKNGANLAYSAAIQAQHKNHVHWVAGSSSVGSYATKAQGPGFWDRVGSAAGAAVDFVLPDWVQGLWSTVTDAKNWLTGKLTGPLGELGANGGNGPLGGWLKEMVGKLPGAMWDKISGTVSGLFSGGSSNDEAVAQTAASGDVKGAVQQAFSTPNSWHTGGQWTAVDNIISKESGWNPKAKNPSSTASGLFQHIDATWKSYRPASANRYGSMRDAPVGDQAIAGRNYIAARYGDPAAAWRYWQANRHYATGGQVLPTFHTGGHTRGWTDEHAAMLAPDERVFSPAQDDYWRRFVDSISLDAPAGRPSVQQLAEKIEVHANDRDQGLEIVDRLWHKVQVADRGGVYLPPLP